MSKKELIKLSSKGFNFKNEPLTENNLRASIKVMWRNKIYQTGNRYKNLVELFSDGKFVRIASLRYVYLVR